MTESGLLVTQEVFDFSWLLAEMATTSTVAVRQHFTIEKAQDLPPYNDDEHLVLTFRNPTGLTMTPAFVNALRRIILSEVPCVAIGDRQNFVSANTSEFNIDFLRKRLALIPFYLRPEDLATFYPGEYCLRLCDPEHWSQPFRHRLAGSEVEPLTGGETQELRRPGGKSKGPNTTVALGLSLAIRTGEHCLLLRLKPAYRRTHHLHYDYRTRQYALYQESGKLMVLATDEDWMGAYERVEEAVAKRLLRYNFYLCRLQLGQELCMTGVPSFGIGQQHAAWQGAVQMGWDFLLAEDQPTIKSAQISHQFLPAKHAGYPALIRFVLEENGHYDNPVALLLALKTLHQKTRNLHATVERILRNSATNLDNPAPLVDGMGAPLHLQQKVQDLTPLFGKGVPQAMAANVVLNLTEETHTMGYLIHLYGLYTLQELLRPLALQGGGSGEEILERYRDWILQSLCSYKLPHPFLSIGIHIKIAENLPPGTQFSPQYRTHRLPVQLLLMTLDRIDNLCGQVEGELLAAFPALTAIDLPKYRSTPIIRPPRDGAITAGTGRRERRRGPVMGEEGEDEEDIEEEETMANIAGVSEPVDEYGGEATVAEALRLGMPEDLPVTEEQVKRGPELLDGVEGAAATLREFNEEFA